MATNGADYSIAVLNRTLDVLDLLTEAETPLGATEIARRIGTTKSAVFRILANLDRRGYVSKEAATSRYTLGVRLVVVGQRALRSLDLRHRARPVLEALLATERVLASVIEAVIGACYLAYGFEPTAEAVRAAFAPEIESALEWPADFKSALQERLARRGALVSYEVTGETGPPHDRTFEVAAMVAGKPVACGSGRSKKEAEQAAAATALESGDLEA